MIISTDKYTLHSGYGAEFDGDTANKVWSHKWVLSSSSSLPWVSKSGVRVWNYHISPGLWGYSGYTISRVGTVAYETGHFLGLPDLYDTDGSGSGLGSWSLMANSWGWDNLQTQPGLMDGWSRLKLGWATPTYITAAGNYTIGSASLDSKVFIINVVCHTVF